MRRFVCNSINYNVTIIDLPFSNFHILKIFIPEITSKTMLQLEIIDTITNKIIKISDWYFPKKPLVKCFI